MKKHRLILLSALAILLFIPQISLAAAPVKLWIHGKNVASDVAPFIENNRTLVPLRVITENVGYDVKWDASTRKITVAKGDVNIALTIGSKDVAIEKDGAKKTIAIEVPAKIKNNRTFVPIRAIGEIFGEHVDWDGNNRTVIIGKGYVPSKEKPQANNKKPQTLTKEESQLLSSMTKGYKGRFTIGYNQSNKTFTMIPLGREAANIRELLNADVTREDVRGQAMYVIHTTSQNLGTLSMHIVRATGTYYVVNIVDPDNPSRILFTANGKTTESNVTFSS